jgi:hypothetical protein
VLDEADLLLSYGYEPDLQLLAPLVRWWMYVNHTICVRVVCMCWRITRMGELMSLSRLMTASLDAV